MENASKYQPLERHLEKLSGSEVPMGFQEVERVLGFPLPPSARRHAAWWSNNRGTNVAVKAWRDAGWKTSKVDVGGERVVFVRDEVAKDAAEAKEGVDDRLIVRLRDLTPAAIRLIDDYVEQQGCDLATAAVAILNAAGAERRRAVFDWFDANASAKPGASAAELIREDRDAR